MPIVRLNKDSDFFSLVFSDSANKVDFYEALFRKDTALSNKKYLENTFVKQCRDMVKQHQFMAILWFVHNIFCDRVDKDLIYLKDLIS